MISDESVLSSNFPYNAKFSWRVWWIRLIEQHIKCLQILFLSTFILIKIHKYSITNCTNNYTILNPTRWNNLKAHIHHVMRYYLNHISFHIVNVFMCIFLFSNEFYELRWMQEDLIANKNLCVYGLTVFIAIIVPTWLSVI